MIRRLAILLLVGGGLWFFLQREEKRGTFDAWEQPVLERLLALAAPPAPLRPEPAASDQETAVGAEVETPDAPVQPSETAAPAVGPPPVVLVELRQGDLPFDGWPPAPLDYALIFESLVRREPAVVAVHAPLAWPAVEPLDAATLSERIALLPRGVLACTLLHAPGHELPPEEMAPTDGPPAPEEDALPLAVFTDITGDVTKIPAWTAPGQAPLPAVRGGKALGFTRIEFGASPVAVHGAVRLPLLARRGEEVVPSLALQALLSWQGVTAADVKIVLGREIIVTPELRVPIDGTGAFHVFATLPPPLPRLPAGTLWLDLERDAGLLHGRTEEKAVLEQLGGALLVIATTGESTPHLATGRDGEWSEGELLARALGAIVTGRHVREVPPAGQSAVWGGVLVAGAALLAAPRRWQALWVPGGALVLALAIVWLFVGSHPHWWLPPVIPLALWLTCGGLALLLAGPRGGETPVAAETAASVAPVEATAPDDPALGASDTTSHAPTEAKTTPTKTSSAAEPSSGADDDTATETEELTLHCLEDEAAPASPDTDAASEVTPPAPAATNSRTPDKSRPIPS